MKLVVLFILASIVLFFFLSYRNDNKLDNHLTEQTEVKSMNTGEDRPPTLSTQKHQLNTVDASSYTLNTMHERHITCGSDISSSFTQRIFSEIEPDSLSEKQLEAIDKLEKKCMDWYAFYESMTDQEKMIFKKDQQKMRKAAVYYQIGKTDPEKISSARGKINDPDDNSLDYAALIYLLTSDTELIEKIASDIGTEDLQYISNLSPYVGGLYECQVSPVQCVSNSSRMLELCISDTALCDMDYFQFLSYSHSENQVSDMHNMVDSLVQLIRRGFFASP